MENEDKNQEWVEIAAEGQDKPEVDSEQGSKAPAKDENLQQNQQDTEDYGERVKRRIAREVAKRKSVEEAALARIRELEAQLENSKKSTSERETAALGTFQQGLEAKLEAAKKKYEDAYDAADKSALSAAQVELNDIQFQLNALKMAPKPKAEAPKEPPKQVQQQQQQGPSPDDLPDATVEWLNKNPWFGRGAGKDVLATQTATLISDTLVEEGWDADSPEFYTEVERRLVAEMPRTAELLGRKPETRKPVPPVNGQTRRPGQGGKGVAVTQGQLAMAEKLGVPKERYAAQVKAIEEAGPDQYTPIIISRRK